MADEFHGYAGLRVELFFKVKNAERFSKAAANQIHAPGAPRPELRTDVIDISDALRAQLARKAEVKAGKIRENCEWWLSALRLFNKTAHGANQRRQTLQHFGDPHDGNFRIIGDDFNASGAHLWPAHAEDGYVQALLQSGGQPRGIHVPGSFTGGEKKRNRRHVRQSCAQSLARTAGGSAARASRGRCSSCSLYWS